MHTVFALLCFVVVIHWLILPYPSGLLHWHCGNLTIAPVPAKQPWWIWINTSCELIMNDCITTTKQSTTKPCAYFLGYTVGTSCNVSEPDQNRSDASSTLVSPTVVDHYGRFAWLWHSHNSLQKHKDTHHLRCGNTLRASNLMMMSSNGIFSALLAFFRWIPHTKASDEELWCFVWSAPE